VKAAESPLPESLSRVRRYTWWALVPFAPAFGLVTVVLLLLGDRAWPMTAVLVALAVAASAAAWHLLDQSLRDADSPPGERGRSRAVAVVGGVGGAVAGAGLTVATGGTAIEWSPLAALMAGCLAIPAPRGRRVWVVVAVAVPVTAAAVWGAGPVGLSAGLVTLLGPWGIWLTWWYYQVARQLDRARLQAAELAVANERLRFAAELHDIQGHHLQVIALKSELAARLADADPAAAVEQMRQVQQLAREALTETRSLVGGYRQVSLGTEIANATRVLAAADIDARPRVALPSGERLGDAERVLGLVVREATTNILRHARARWARIELDEVAGAARLQVANDGVGPVPGAGADGRPGDRPTGDGVGGDGVAGDPAAPGGGLPALAERLSATGGRLEWGRDGDEFTVTATTPLRAGDGMTGGAG